MIYTWHIKIKKIYIYIETDYIIYICIYIGNIKLLYLIYVIDTDYKWSVFVNNKVEIKLFIKKNWNYLTNPSYIYNYIFYKK